MIQDTVRYLMQPQAWFAPGPLIVSATYVLVVLGLWIALWQVAPNKASSGFYHRRNSVWTGVLMVLVGIVVYTVFNASVLIEVYKPLLKPQFLVPAGIAIGLVVLGLLIAHWARKQPQS